MKLDAHSESWPTLIPFQITGMTYHSFESIVVALSQDGKVGRGEALGVDYRGETIAGMMAQVEALRATIGSGRPQDPFRFASSGWGAQCARLRALGSRGQNQRPH